jgi:hypothetical protein
MLGKMSSSTYADKKVFRKSLTIGQTQSKGGEPCCPNKVLLHSVGNDYHINIFLNQ